MSRKRITILDVLNECRRARRILNRTIRYLEQQERHERRVRERQQRTPAQLAADRENERMRDERIIHGGERPSERAMRLSRRDLGEQG